MFIAVRPTDDGFQLCLNTRGGYLHTSEEVARLQPGFLAWETSRPALVGVGGVLSPLDPKTHALLECMDRAMQLLSMASLGESIQHRAGALATDLAPALLALRADQ